MDIIIESKKDLELIIQEIPGYKNPNIELEQYITDAKIVAQIIWNAFLSGEIENAKVLDLGCGTGRFAIASALMGAYEVLCIDIDKNAIDVAIEYSKKLNLTNIDFLVQDVTKLVLSKKFDVTFQNPPFGIQSYRGIDIQFLRKAIEYSNIVYSIHKYETLDYVIRKVNEWGFKAKPIMIDEITIPLMYKHHMKMKHKVKIVVIKVFKD